MKKDRLLKITDIYCTYFENKNITMRGFPVKHHFPTRTQILAHCYAMLKKMKVSIEADIMTIEDGSEALRFIQGCLWSEAVYTLEEIIAHNTEP